MKISSYVLMERLLIYGVGVLTEAVSVYSVHMVLIHATVSGELPTTRSSNVIPTVKTLGDTRNIQAIWCVLESQEMMTSFYVLMERLLIYGVGVLTEAVSVYSVHVVLIHATVSGELPTTRSSNVIP